jgi:hypothetical protein
MTGVVDGVAGCLGGAAAPGGAYYVADYSGGYWGGGEGGEGMERGERGC